MNSKSLYFKKNKVRLILWNIWLRLSKIKLHGVTIGWGSWIKSELTIGYGSATGWGFVVRGAGKAQIGRYCAIGENVRIITSNHYHQAPVVSFGLQSKIYDKNFQVISNVVIGHDVWIGDSVTILPGVNVGTGAVIGAGSVVTSDITPYSIAAGSPAKVIKSRFSHDKTKNFLQKQWWKLDFTSMKSFFNE